MKTQAKLFGKTFLGLLLAVLMMLSVPMVAFAADEEVPPPEESELVEEFIDRFGANTAPIENLSDSELSDFLDGTLYTNENMSGMRASRSLNSVLPMNRLNDSAEVALASSGVAVPFAHGATVVGFEGEDTNIAKAYTAVEARDIYWPGSNPEGYRYGWLWSGGPGSGYNLREVFYTNSVCAYWLGYMVDQFESVCRASGWPPINGIAPSGTQRKLENYTWWPMVNHPRSDGWLEFQYTSDSYSGSDHAWVVHGGITAYTGYGYMRDDKAPKSPTAMMSSDGTLLGHNQSNYSNGSVVIFLAQNGDEGQWHRGKGNSSNTMGEGTVNTGSGLKYGATVGNTFYADGRHSISMRLVDWSANYRNVTKYVYIDATKPPTPTSNTPNGTVIGGGDCSTAAGEVTVKPVGGIDQPDPGAGGYYSGHSHYEYSLNGGAWQRYNDNTGLRLVANEDTSATYTVQFRSVDKAWNYSDPSPVYTYTVHAWCVGVKQQFKWIQGTPEFTGTYSSYTTLTPEQTADYGGYRDAQKQYWNQTHTNQTSATENSDLGNWYNTNASAIQSIYNLRDVQWDYEGKYSDVRDNPHGYTKAQYEQERDRILRESSAIMATDYVKSPTINISAANQQSFANGGVMTITEYRRWLTVKLPARREQSRYYYYRRSYDYNSYAWTHRPTYDRYGPTSKFGVGNNVDQPGQDWNNACLANPTITGGPPNCYPASQGESAWADYRYWSAHTASQVAITNPIPHSFWQMLNAHCNKPGVDAALAAANAIYPGMINSSIGDGKATGTLYTPSISATKDKPFGNPTHPVAALRATGYDAFFTSTISCGVPDCSGPGCIPGPGPAPGDQLISCVPDRNPGGANDSNNNVGTGEVNEEEGGNRYGAQSADGGSDLFIFFRDNQKQTVRVDLWYPLITDSSGAVIYDGNGKAKGTQIVFDKAGTPNDENFWRLDDSKTGGKLADGITVSKPGGSISENQKQYHTRQINFFDSYGSWASDKDKPHRWNLGWLYQPTLVNNGYGTVSGKSGGINANTGQKTIDVYCDMNLNTSTPQQPRVDNSLFPITNGDRRPTSEFNDTRGKWLGVYYIRTVGE